jgi:D-alanyl-D-alanine carboxypeptidase
MIARSILAGLTALAVLTVGTQAVSAEPRNPVQHQLQVLVHDQGFPGALAAVRDRAGRSRNYTAGPAIPVDGQVRIGSNTKTFTAVAVLQLVAQGQVDLDKSVDTYLPGLLRGDGIDGRTITVRQILQHTSGLPNYTEYIDLQNFEAIRHRYIAPRDLLDLALAHPAEFAPGTSWKYSNTNYIVAGLLVEKITGRPLAEVINDRVVRKAGLRHTYFPAVGDESIRERHPHGYAKDPSGAMLDVTEFDPDMAWGAGAMISTPSDLNAFFGALIGGRLLPAAQLAQMRTTVPAPEMGQGVRYGLALMSTPLSCGGVSWGHGGDIFGFETDNAVTEDGRAAAVAVTMLPQNEQQATAVRTVVDTALCQD